MSSNRFDNLPKELQDHIYLLAHKKQYADTLVFIKWFKRSWLIKTMDDDDGWGYKTFEDKDKENWQSEYLWEKKVGLENIEDYYNWWFNYSSGFDRLLKKDESASKYNRWKNPPPPELSLFEKMEARKKKSLL